MDAIRTIEECDKRLDVCRQTLATLQVRSSRSIVWDEIDRLLEQRTRLARRRSASVSTPVRVGQ